MCAKGGGANLVCIKINSNIFTEVCSSAVMRRVSHTYDLCLVAVLLLAANHKLLHLLCVCITKQTLLWKLPTALCATAAWQHLQKSRFDLIWRKVSARESGVCAESPQRGFVKRLHWALSFCQNSALCRDLDKHFTTTLRLETVNGCYY